MRACVSECIHVYTHVYTSQYMFKRPHMCESSAFIHVDGVMTCRWGFYSVVAVFIIADVDYFVIKTNNPSLQ